LIPQGIKQFLTEPKFLIPLTKGTILSSFAGGCE